MDLVRIAVRALFAYIFVLALIRTSGKRTVGQGDITSFVVALIVGDLFDDLIWAEVSGAEFVTAAGALVFIHLLVDITRCRSGERLWRNVRPGRAEGP